MYPAISKITYAPLFIKAMERCRKKDPTLHGQAEQQVAKTIRQPEFGKPLRYDLRNCRRMHVGSFVILYEFHAEVLEFLDFDHHDKIYKKFL